LRRIPRTHPVTGLSILSGLFLLSILWQINTTGRSLRSLWNNLERPMGQSWSRLGVNRRSKQVVSCVVHIDCLTVSVDLHPDHPCMY
jgi:hypothetical protein